jgi:predicted O-methyltransferase YrrM
MSRRTLKSAVKSLPVIKRLVPVIKRLVALRHALSANSEQFTPGHFYSTIPCRDEVRRDADRIFDLSLRQLAGIDLNIEGQLATLEHLKAFYPEQPFGDEPRQSLRYFFRNDSYTHADALFLHCIIRWMKPKEIVEVGSGNSSFVMLDTNEIFFNGRIRVTCIEPYDALLRSRLKDRDFQSIEILAKRVQEVPLSVFDRLHEGDILFIDSSHVSKVGSDVNYLLFEVLPRLRPGVLVHFHDMFFPFEYPEEWITNGRFWNEDYLVRAFLQYNSAFQIVVWDQFLMTYFRDKLEESMPLCLKSVGGSLWLKRV